MSYTVFHMERFAYSVRELVDKLAPDDDEEEKLKLLRQVRHWTNADLLLPLGEKHTGTGVSRKYGPDEVRKAAILRDLSRFGLTVNKLEGIEQDLSELTDDPQWQKAITGEQAVYMEFLWSPDGAIARLISNDDNLLRILRPSWKPARAKKGQFQVPDPNFTSAIVLSLNRIFSRLAL